MLTRWPGTGGDQEECRACRGEGELRKDKAIWDPRDTAGEDQRGTGARKVSAGLRQRDW